MQRLVEPVMGTNFHIGPFTHFLTNTSSAQILYQGICDLVQPGPNVTIVDICAGIGSVGLTLAKVMYKSLMNFNYISESKK